MSIHAHAVTVLDALLDRIAEPQRDVDELAAMEVSPQRHAVEPAQVPWVTALLRALCHACGRLAGDAARTADEVAATLGAAPAIVQGGRCMTCGYAEVTMRDIDHFVAGLTLHEALASALPALEAAPLVDAALQCDVPGADLARNRLREALMRRGLEVSARRSTLERCPSCEGDATCVYRWRLTDDGQLEATRDNLPLRATG